MTKRTQKELLEWDLENARESWTKSETQEQASIWYSEIKRIESQIDEMEMQK